MRRLQGTLYFLLAAALVPAAAGNLRVAPPDLYLAMGEFLLQEEKVYIVQLAEPPALTYRGGRSNLAATRPARGERFNPDDPDVRRYGRHLMAQHDASLRSVGAYYEKLYSYRYAFNGYAARMTALQAQKLRAQRNVLNVWEDRVRYLHTNDTPGFLGLFNSGSGLRTALGLKGEGVVIGVIDSGIAPEHPSFEDTAEAEKPRLCRSSWAENSLLGLWLCYRFRKRDEEVVYDVPPGWQGRCEAGETPAERFSSTDCNNKLIGARYYIDGFLQSNALDENEFISPRDADGHGTHIASTAAGNEVGASIAGNDVARISGMAPRARIAVYKACWLEPGATRGSCATSDLQRAIEDAVADGVDIINYSVGSSDRSIGDPDDLALLAAADAGVLSVVAAGNDGPLSESILSPAGAPWVLTVGASTKQGTKFEEALRVNRPASIAGEYVQREASFTPLLSRVGPVTEELVLVDDGVSIFGGGASGTTYDGCEPVQNNAELDGRIALMQRTQSLCNFETKLRNAEDAGAIAAIVFDDQGEPIVMAGPRDVINIPAVSVSLSDGIRLRDRLNAGDSVEVTLDKNLLVQESVAGNVMAGFSSRGPNLTSPDPVRSDITYLDVLKPDLTAPGVDILAGQTPDVANGIRGELFQYLSGTSMSVPHVAGIAALLKQRHPDWSPAALSSALMTTARQNVVKQDGQTPADPFDIGAGHVVPNAAIRPGLVYDAGKADFDAFLCGAQMPRASQEECDALQAAGFSTEAADLNLPSITVSSLVNDRTVTRRVTNVGEAGTYEAQVVAPPGVEVSVVPSVLSLAAGETADFSLTLAKTDAPLYEWGFGSLTWDDGEHRVRSPITVRPVPFVTPLEVAGRGTTGELEFDVEFGYSGAYSARKHGLAPADVVSAEVQDDPLRNYVFEPDDTRLPDSVARFVFDVADNAIYFRVALFNADTDGNDDLDLYVYRCPVGFGCNEVGFSGNNDSDEQIDVLRPFAGQYVVDVHGFRTDQAAGGPGARFDLSVWVLGEFDDRGNFSVNAPADATEGQTGTISVQWAGLDPVRYLGGISHDDDDNPADLLEFTVIAIEP
jgi:subtilisin family serine protease